MPFLQYHNGRYHITVPLDYVEELRWKKGDKLITTLERDSVVLKKARDVK